MSKTLIGITAFGGIEFVEVAIRSIQETCLEHTLGSEVEILVVVARPNDSQMKRFLEERGIRFIDHTANLGFPVSVNDCHDAAFTQGDFDHLIIMGNDVVALPGSIDALIRTADTTEFEMVCGSEFNARFLVENYPAAKKFFQGESLNFTNFKARPWELHRQRRTGIEPHQRKDIRNFTLFKCSAFQKVGYADPNFWPNGYFEDNDACRRMDILGVSACGLLDAPFFHFVSRTIHQNTQRDHHGYFQRNSGQYVHKWGGGVGGETYTLPYDGRGMTLSEHIFLSPDLKISNRDQESAIVQYWSTR